MYPRRAIEKRMIYKDVVCLLTGIDFFYNDHVCVFCVALQILVTFWSLKHFAVDTVFVGLTKSQTTL